MASNQSPSFHPSLALAAYASSLLAGRRAAVIGNAQSGLAELVAKLTARRVHAYDAVPERVASALASHGGDSEVSFAPLAEARDAHEGAFDAVILDCGQGDPSELVEVAATLLSPRGFVLLASPNPERLKDAPHSPATPGYYGLYDLVSERFEHIHMLGQAPFAGYTVAEFAPDGEPSVTIDTSLSPQSEEPHYFVALASLRPLEGVEPYTLIQVPVGTLDQRLAASRARPEDDGAALAEAQLQIAMLKSEMDRLRQQEREAREQSKERQAATSVMSSRMAELEAEREQKQRAAAARGRELETALADARRRADEASERLREAEARAEQAERRAQRASELAEKARAKLTAELKQAEARADEAEAKLRRAAAPAPRKSDDKRLEKRLRRLEDELARASEEHEKKLAAELARAAEEQAEELARELEEAQDSHQEELDMMLERIAELEDQLTEGIEAQRAVKPAGGATRESAAEQPKGIGGAPDVRTLSFQIEELRQALSEARQQRDAAHERSSRVEALEKELSALRAAQKTKEPDDTSSEAAIDALEARLRDRGHLLASLKSELREAERVGRELVRRLAPGEGEGGSAEALLQRCSRYEADLQAAKWKIESLQQQVASAGGGEGDHGLLEDALRRSQAEVAELRRTLSERQ